MPNQFIAGLDLGQASDYTALAIVELVPPEPTDVPADLDRLHVRHLERFPIGTSYTTIVADVGERLQALQDMGPWELVIDRTGVGRPVFDMFEEAGLQPIGITITSGSDATKDDGGWKVPKRDLIGAIQRPLHQERLKFAKGLPEVDTLVKELLNFKVKITASANDTYSAWRESDKDDLVLSLGCAAWYAARLQGTIFSAASGGVSPALEQYRRMMSRPGGRDRIW